MKKKYFGSVIVGINYLHVNENTIKEVIEKLEKTPIDNKRAFMFGIIDITSSELVQVGQKFIGKEEFVKNKLILLRKSIEEGQAKT